MKLYRCFIQNSTGIKKGESDHDRYFIGIDSGVIVRIHGKNEIEIYHVSNLGGDGCSKVVLFSDGIIYDIADLLKKDVVKAQEVKIVDAVSTKKNGRPKIYP